MSVPSNHLQAAVFRKWHPTHEIALQGLPESYFIFYSSYGVLHLEINNFNQVFQTMTTSLHTSSQIFCRIQIPNAISFVVRPLLLVYVIHNRG